MKLISISLLIISLNPSNCQNVEWDVSNIFSPFVNSTEFQDVASGLSQIFSNHSIAEILSIYNVFEPLQELWQTESLCMQQIRLLVEGVENKELWAIKMGDASAKLQPGLLYGNVFHFGNYDECIEINHPHINVLHPELNGIIKGQYCTAFISVSEVSTNSVSANNESEISGKEVELAPLSISLGLCVPSGCSSQDMQNITDRVLQNVLPQLKLNFNDRFCSTEDKEKHIPLRSFIAIIIFAAFGLIIIVGTFIDVYDCCGSNAVLKCFSLYTNGKKLLTVSSNEDALNCLNGIRVLSMMLILLGHRFIFTRGLPAVNSIFVKRWTDYWYNYIYIGLGFAVDTFFTVSGLLVVYLYFRASEKGRKISWKMFYLHRLLRLTPSLLMVVLFYSTMLQFIEHEPFPFIDVIYGKNCRENWWTTILYIQNYLNPNDMCAVQTWYLAIDTQLYFLSPLLLIALKKFPLRAVFCILLLAFFSMGAAFEVTWQRLLGATFLNQNPEEYKYLYTPTHIRVPPWLFGALTGYFIAKNKEKSVPMSKLLVNSLWLLSLGSLLFVLLIQKNYHDSEYSVLDSALFNAFARPIWGAAICMITWLCVFGHGGLINTFLSCSIFNVLIRINYAFYLIHMMVITALLANIRTPIFLSDFYIVHEALGDYFLVLIIATIWTLAFESPIIALEKILYSKGEYGKDKYRLDKKSNDSKGSCETVIVR